MMLYGEGVYVKYGVIMDARQAELMTNVKSAEHHAEQSDKLMQFRDYLRNCKPSEFNEMYELYKDYRPDRKR